MGFGCIGNFTKNTLSTRFCLPGWSSENLPGDDLREVMTTMSGWLLSGELTPPPYEVFPIAEAGLVHGKTENNKIMGRIFLVP